MFHQEPHPSSDELSAFTLGQLPPQKAEEVELHISDCHPCCETMMALGTDDDTFVGLLKEVGDADDGRASIAGLADHKPEAAAKSVGSARQTSLDEALPSPLLNHSRYEIERVVGRGGMGQVFKARHRMMNRSVALKVIHQEWVRRQEAIDRFRREVQTAASLDHPHIVTAFDAEQADDLHFLVMEYVDGVDLSETVRDRGSLPVEEACEYIRQAAEGLQYAHDRGMVHRDIKPHNLMVTQDGTLKILDFGLASLAPQATPTEPISEDADGNLTVAGAIMGTPDFISPEQAQDAHKVDGRSDIYSLGMTLYFLLAGRVPFDKGSATDKLKLHAEAHPAKLMEVRADVPDGVQQIFDRMTAKDPAERFQTPQDVADALQEYFGEPPATETDKSAAASGGSWRWLLIAGVVLITSFGLFAYQNPHLFSWRVAADSDVYAPVSELESYVAAMASSPHELVFMNVYELGPDAVTLGFMVKNTAVEMDIDVPSSSRENRSRGRYANRMKEIAAALSVPVTEEADMAEDGSVQGVKFVFRLTGDPSTIASNAQKLVMDGLDLQDDGDVMISCLNFRSHVATSESESARLVSSEEFVAEYKKGDRIFLGENQQHVYLVPEERSDESPLTMNDGVWYTDVRELPPGFAREMRMQAAEQWHVARLSNSSTQTAGGGSTASQAMLELTHKTANGGQGLPKMHRWHFRGQNVGDWIVRLWLAEKGEASMVQEFDFEELPNEFDSDVLLQIKDSVGAGHMRTVNAMLSVESPTNSRCSTTNEDKGLSLKLEAPFGMKREQADLKQVTPDEQKLLYAHAYWKGDMTHSTSMESMTKATKDGTVAFLFVTTEWKPTDEQQPPTIADGQDDQATEMQKVEKAANILGTPETNPTGYLMWRISHKHGDFSDHLKKAISEAAGIPADQWESFARSPTASTESIEGEPLSMVLLSLNPFEAAKDNEDKLNEFRLLQQGVPKPGEFNKAMSPSMPLGFYSMLQPSYLEPGPFYVKPNANGVGGKITGSMSFESKMLYSGNVKYMIDIDAEYHVTVVMFELPNYGIRIGRDPEGIWTRDPADAQKPTPEPATAGQDTQPESPLPQGANIQPPTDE